MRRVAARRAPGRAIELEIAAIGARGDGIAYHDGGPIYIPFAAPGDRVLARLGPARGDGRIGHIQSILAGGPGRTPPHCRHFGRCGGCALQHLGGAHYAEAKRALLVRALERHGLGDAPIAPLRLLPPGTRRRARLSLLRPIAASAPARIGFAERASHAIVDLAECPVLGPPLLALVSPLRRLVAEILAPGEAGHATLQGSEGGIDVLLDLPRPPGLQQCETLAAFAEAADLARLCWRAAGSAAILPIAQRRAVRMNFSGVAVDIPPDAFLQATSEAEAALRQSVLDALRNARRIADLFAGLGTFSFALATQAQIRAVEGWRPAVLALRQAARRAGLEGRVVAEERDLEASPLGAAELDACDAVVFDPPRSGAKAQAAALARSRVPRIAAVSCNPATFARDARALVDGGYRLRQVEPIDQFVWSPHLELVARFDR